jgi:regulator of protease activity HflC (stomatin/prohibitin superfamily)
VLDELLSEREKINAILQAIIDEATGPWGVKVSIVEVKDVEIPCDMQRAMARQAEAERERRAKIINAQGEFQAAAQLAEAADVISRNPVTIQLRYLQTLSEIGVNQNSTVVFPLPMNLITPLLEAAGRTTQAEEPDKAGEEAPGELPPGNGAGELGGLAAPRPTEEAEARDR